MSNENILLYNDLLEIQHIHVLIKYRHGCFTEKKKKKHHLQDSYGTTSKTRLA